MIRLLSTLAAAVLAIAAAALALPVTPAQAAYCSGGAGVSVLIDHGSLGGGTVTACGGGSTADRAFSSAGFTLTDSQQQHGFVCQVNEKPRDGEPCTGTTSYWGFFVSDDGKPWAYASLGVHQQAVDPGDSVALVWQSSGTQRKPSPAPEPSVGNSDSSTAPSTKTTKRPKPKPTKRPVRSTPTAEPTTAAATPSPSAPVASSATPTPKRSPRSRPAAAAPPTTATPTPTLAPTPSPSPTTEVTQDATEQTAADEGGLPGWVPPLIVVVLVAAAGGIGWARRAR